MGWLEAVGDGRSAALAEQRYVVEPSARHVPDLVRAGIATDAAAGLCREGREWLIVVCMRMKPVVEQLRHHEARTEDS